MAILMGHLGLPDKRERQEIKVNLECQVILDQVDHPGQLVKPASQVIKV